MTVRILPALAALSLIATPALGAPEPSLTPVASSYRLDAGEPALFSKGTILTAYAEQDEAVPAPEKKSKTGKTLLYIGGGLLLLVGLLYVIADNTVVLPDGSVDGA